MTGEIEIIGPGGLALPDEHQLPALERPNISGASNDEQLISAWLSAGELSMHTIKLYEHVAMKLLSHLPRGLRGATVLDVSSFELSLRGMKIKSRHTYMAAARSLFRFCERTNYILKSPAHIRANRRPANSMHERCLTEEEVWSIIDHAGSERNARMLSFLYGTGVRIVEFERLVWRDSYWLGPTDNRMQVVSVLGKRNIRREVPVPKFAAIDMPSNADPDDAMFPVAEKGLHPWPSIAQNTMRWIVTMAALKAGIRKKVSPHWFRHSACTHLQDKGVPPKDVQALLGHASLDTTTGYSHASLLKAGAPGNVLARRRDE